MKQIAYFTHIFHKNVKCITTQHGLTLFLKIYVLDMTLTASDSEVLVRIPSLDLIYV